MLLDLIAFTQPTAGSTNTAPPFEVQTFSVKGELVSRVVVAELQVLLGVPAFTTGATVQVVVSTPEKTIPGTQEPSSGWGALNTVSRHSVAT